MIQDHFVLLVVRTMMINGRHNVSENERSFRIFTSQPMICDVRYSQDVGVSFKNIRMLGSEVQTRIFHWLFS
jgi:hypothetical protein